MSSNSRSEADSDATERFVWLASRFADGVWAPQRAECQGRSKTRPVVPVEN